MSGLALDRVRPVEALGYALLALGCVLSSCVAQDDAGSVDARPTRLRWEPLETGSRASLRGVAGALDPEGRPVFWASGSDGTVLRSADGGDSWQACGDPAWVAGEGDPADLRDIEARSADEALAITITAPARVVRTTDAGRTWRTVHASDDPRSFFDSIALLEDGGALVFGDPLDGVFEVVRSVDGSTWTRRPAAALPPAGEGEAAFAASGTCLVTRGHSAWIATGGGQARVLSSSDAGATWRAHATPVRQGGATEGLYGIAFRDAAVGFAVGGDYTRPGDGANASARTEDGGRTWIAPLVPPAGYRSCVAYWPGSPDVLVTVGRGGCDWSRDGGRTWQATGGGEGYFAVAFAPDGTGLAVGAEGRAARLVFE